VMQFLDDVVVVRCDRSRAFKFGVDGDEAWILSVTEQPDGRLLAYSKEMPAFSERSYAHGCLAEVYNAEGQPYLEIELHGPHESLLPGESFEIVERQRVSPLDHAPSSAEEVRAIVKDDR
jgi:hypothetical protein